MPDLGEKGSLTGLEVAVIGMAGRFPGARNIGEFWDNLKAGVESLSFFSEEELLAEGIDAGIVGQPGYVKVKGIVPDIEYFDASFFGYTPKEVEIMDPQLRVLHQCAYEALESAGYDADSYPKPIGLYAGAHPELSWLGAAVNRGQNPSAQFDVTTANTASAFSTRIAYKLNLKGPGFSVHTACSTTLVVVHLACQGLLNAECDMALAGGVGIMLPQRSGYLYQEGMIGSPDGHCRAFDARSKGIVGGNGVGMVVLKRLEDAAIDGDHVYAVVKGSAVNNDGLRKAGYTVPSVEGQAEVIQMALTIAEVEAESIGYVETHGTATRLGDPIEIEGLTHAFNTDSRHFCAIGSVKTNIGHLDTAAGIVSFIKTVLALKHRLIPPSLHFERPNPEINFIDSPFYVNTGLQQWPRGRYPRRAGVSSFGIGGTNAHVILEEYLSPGAEGEDDGTGSAGYGNHHLILLSARTEAALKRVAENLAAYFRDNPDVNLADVAFTLQLGRRAYEHRQMLICAHVAEAVQGLKSQPVSALAKESLSLVFMFPGQGVQYVNMGRDLYDREPLFRQELDRGFETLEALVEEDVRKIVYPEATRPVSSAAKNPADERINQTEVAQPLIFIFEYALARLLITWGIHPQAMIGHSIGEYTAACLSGVMTFADACRLVVLRGKLMQQIPPGAMLNVPLSEEETMPVLSPEIALAAVNSSNRCVLSGTPEAIEKLAGDLQARGLTVRRLHTSHAFHSPMMAPVLGEFKGQVSSVKLASPRIPYISNLTGTWIRGHDAADPSYWARHLRETVRFEAGLRELLKESHTIFLEIGPRTLSTFVQQHRQKRDHHLTLNLLRHPREHRADDTVLLSQLGQLWLYGLAVDWRQYYAAQRRKRLPLPTYPFDRQPFPVKIDAPRYMSVEASEGLSLRRESDIARWFYIPAWQRSEIQEIPSAREFRAANVLVFMDELGLGKGLVDRFRRAGHRVTAVQMGAEFTEESAEMVRINPGSKDDYEALLATLVARERVPETIVHLWSVSAQERSEGRLEEIDAVLDRGFYSLIFLVQAIGSKSITGKIHLEVVSSRTQQVTGDDVLSPLNATVLAAVKIIPLEYPHIRCRSIDIVLPSPGSIQQEALSERLVEEFRHEPDRQLIAYRGYYRWQQTFQPMRLEEPGGIPAILKPGGVYLITGGLGGMGLELARYLARTVQPKLILTDKSPLPPKDRWQAWLASHGQDDRVNLKIQKVQELERLGAEVSVFGADAADLEQSRLAVIQGEKRFGTVNGIIHAAGVPDGRLIQLRTRQMTDDILAAKVKGTLVLENIFKDHHLDFVVLCSSLSSILVSAGQVGYTAANIFLDRFAGSCDFFNGTHVVSVNWDAWQEVGMAVDAAGQTGVDHPMLASRLDRGGGETIYVSRFSVKDHWFVAEHRLNGQAALPGTAYLEMARAALENMSPNDPDGRHRWIELSDLHFLAPLILDDEETKEVRTVLKSRANGFTFSVSSRSQASAGQKHATGNIDFIEARREKKQNIEEMAQRFTPGKPGVYPDGEGQSGSGLVQVGPHWQNLKTCHMAGHRGLALLSLPGAFASETGSYHLHPALLDTATAFLVERVGGQGRYLPFYIKKIRIKKPLTDTVYSYAELEKSAGPSEEVLEFNITVMNTRGEELVEVTGFMVKTVSPDRWSDAPTLTGESNDFQDEFIEGGIRNEEGTAVFARVLSSRLPQVVVSTRDLLHRLERPGEAAAKDVPAEPAHQRPELKTRYEPPRSATEHKLADIWQRLMGIRQVGIFDDFFELGGDSLKALTVISRIHKELNVEVTLTDIFNNPNVAGLAERIANAGESIYSSIRAAEQKEYYPLSSAQKRLYLLWRMRPDNLFYNIPVTMVAEGPLNRQILDRAFQTLIRRHESLRTSFQIVDEEPVQVIHRQVGFRLKYRQAEERVKEIVEAFCRPFDLAKPPLFRLEIVQTGAALYLWLFDIHHIVADATGYAVLHKELMRLYRGESLAEVRIQYKDFSVWQGEQRRNGTWQKQEAYWREVFADGIPQLHLAPDFPRPPEPTFAGRMEYLSLDREASSRFIEVASRTGATLFQHLLATLFVLLSKYTGQKDIVVGTSIAGRPHADLQEIVGMFVNMLPLRTLVDENRTYLEFLKGVKQTALAAFENQDMQFERLVDILNLSGGTSANPIFDICFNFENYEQPPFTIEGVKFSYYQYEYKTARFDMLLWANEVKGELSFMLEYSTELFKPSTAAKFLKHLEEIVNQVGVNPQRKIKDLTISHKYVKIQAEVPGIDFEF
jgi:phthiocerol/phenolphthiocerol synthesis type-I polyketide synthase E